MKYSVYSKDGGITLEEDDAIVVGRIDELYVVLVAGQLEIYFANGSSPIGSYKYEGKHLEFCRNYNEENDGQFVVFPPNFEEMRHEQRMNFIKRGLRKFLVDEGKNLSSFGNDPTKRYLEVKKLFTYRDNMLYYLNYKPLEYFAVTNDEYEELSNNDWNYISFLSGQ